MPVNPNSEIISNANWQNAVKTWNALSPTLSAMLTRSNATIELNSGTSIGTEKRTSGTVISISRTTFQSLINSGTPNDILTLGLIIAHELSHAIDSGGYPSSKYIPSTFTPNTSVSREISSEAVAYTKEFQIALELGTNFDGFGAESKAAFSTLYGKYVADGGAINATFIKDARSYLTSYVPDNFHPSSAPTLTYRQYDQYSFVLGAAGIDTSKIDWSSVSSSNFTVTSPGSPTWSFQAANIRTTDGGVITLSGNIKWTAKGAFAGTFTETVTSGGTTRTLTSHSIGTRSGLVTPDVLWKDGTSPQITNISTVDDHGDVTISYSDGTTERIHVQPSIFDQQYAGFANSFGSTLGRLLGGSSLVIGTLSGSVISAAALTIGQQLFNIGYYPKLSAGGDITTGTGSVFADFGNNLGVAIKNAGTGAASNYLALELGQAIGLSGFGAGLFSTAVGGVLNHVLTNAVNGASLFSGIVVNNAATGAVNAAATINNIGNIAASGFAGFFGQQLASLIVTPTTPVEAVFGSLGSAALSIFADTSIAHILGVTGSLAGPVGVLVGTFVGFIVGVLFGSLFGHRKPRIPTASAETVLQVPYARYALGTETSANGGDLQLADAMAKAARDTLNGLIAQITGGKAPSFVSNTYSPTQTYGLSGSQIYVKLAGSQTNVSSADQAVDKGVIWALPQTKIIGGDLILKRAIANTGAQSVVALLGDLQIAKDYETYLQNAPAIDASISSSWNSLSSADQSFFTTNKSFMTRALSMNDAPLNTSDMSFYNLNKTQVDRIIASTKVSSFAAGWIVTLARAAELKLDKFSASDFFGGLQGFLQSFNVDSTGTAAHFEDATVQQSGNDLIVKINGSAGPTTFALLPTSSSDGSSVNVTNFASSAGYNITGASGISAANDLIIIGGSTATTVSAGMSAISVPAYGIYIPATNTGDDIIVGSSAADNISAGVGNDWIDGGAGNDTIVGGAGRDVLIGGGGDDNIQAGAGSTYLSGGDGNDVLRGGAGDDTIVGGAGSDTMTGSTGNDTFIIDQDGGGVYDLIDGGDGSDTASFERFTSGVSIDMSNQSLWAAVVTLAANTQLNGGQSLASADGRYTLAYQTDGNLVLYGINGAVLWASNTSGTSVGRAVMQGDGNLVIYDAGNVARWSSVTSGNAGANLQLDNTGLLRVVRTNGTAAWQVGGGGALQIVNNTQIYGDSWRSIENLTGSNYNDTLTGSNYGSTLRGLDGDDILNGGSGNDTLEGGTGADTLNGGGGSNTASYANSLSGVYVNLATGAAVGGDATGDIYTNIQNLTGSANADELAGDGGVNIIDAGAGDDWIDATAGADTYTGGDGSDTVDYSATNFASGSGTVTVVIPGYGTYSYVGTIPAISVNLSANSVTVRNPDGSTATQTVTSIEQFIGTNGSDSFSSAGTSLNVTWDGGAGTDTASGGSGSDTYVYGRGYGNLTISDSNAASNTITFKSGVTFDDLWANYSSGSLQIGIRGQANFATVTSNFVSGNNVIKTIDLAGAAQVDVTQIQGVNVLSDGNDTFNGTAGFSRFILANNGDDTINPFTNAYSTTSSIIDGGLGNDTIITSAGDDQFLFERGDGHDTITDGGGQNTILFGPTVGNNDVIYQVVGNDLYVGIKDINNSSLTASQVADNIRIIGGGVQYVGMIYGGTYMATNFSVEAGGTTTDLTKANIAWTQTPYYDGGYYYPVVLDLNNDGLEITPVSQSDIVTKDAAGNVLRTSWVGPTNGILAFDRNGDGKINNTADISFVQDKAGATTDLEGLAGWDTNGDGVLDAKDTNFGKLVVWVDSNQDGRAQSKEVKTLAQLGIASINLAPTPTGFDGKDTIDTVVRNTTTFTRSDGTTGTGYDVGFARQLLSGPAATSDAKSIDPTAVGTFGQLKNDPLSLAQARGLTGDKLTSKALGSLANVDTSDAGGSMSAANAARWADIIDPAKNQARKALMAKGGDDGTNLDAIRSTKARPDGSTVLTGRGIRDAATRLQAIVVDFNRNGAELIDAAKSNALVDATNSGNAAQIGWVKSSDGILALDRNGDGMVDPATEMSFVGDVPNTRTGLQGLAAYDDNGDGILSAADSSFAKFLIWRDANGNGVSDVGEVQTLAQAGVKDLRLNVSQVRPDRGVGSSNDVLGVSQIDFTDGSSRALYDVALGFADSKDQTSTQQTTATGNAATLLQAASATTQAATGGSSSGANSGSSASQGTSSLTSVGRARGSLDGPGGLVVQSAATAQDDAQWWRNASIVGQNLADLAAPLTGEGTTLAANGSSIASASSADAATLQRLMLLRQNMAGQGGSAGGDAAVWARGTGNDAATALAANTASTLTTIPKASLAA
jgi:hypothetical protein